MKTEKIISKSSNRCLNVAVSRVDSLRINNDVFSTVRIYDNGAIGVEGALGIADMNLLQQKASQNLQQGIPYPETHDQPATLRVDTTKHIFDEKEFIPKVSALLARLATENPQFIFNNKVFFNSSEENYTNSDGVDYFYKGNQFIISLTIKHKGSANIMDETYGAESDYFDEDQICHDIKQKCDAFLNKILQVEEDEYVIIGDPSPLQYAIQHLIADLYFNNASLLCGKLGQKVFSEKLNLCINRDPKKQINLSFFDAEGVVNPNFVNYIIKNGVVEKLITCKKSAEQYGTDNLGSANADYNGVPSLGIGGLHIDDSAKDLAQLVKGKAIYLALSSGGDMTPNGDISMPAMVAYLYEDGKLVGRLPELTVSVNLFDVLGKDFIGFTSRGFNLFGRQEYFVYKAKLVNKSNW